MRLALLREHPARRPRGQHPRRALPARRLARVLRLRRPRRHARPGQGGRRAGAVRARRAAGADLRRQRPRGADGAPRPPRGRRGRDGLPARRDAARGAAGQAGGAGPAARRRPAGQPRGVPPRLRGRRAPAAVRDRAAAVAGGGARLGRAGTAHRRLAQPAGRRRSPTTATRGWWPQHLATADVAPERLTLELLENGAVEHSTEQRSHSLQGFTDLGVRLAQDDLGSGYSSLLRLRHFAFDEVKIDQSLVRGTEFAPGAALHFIQPITDIAHSLGLDVIIEGLETPGLIEAAVQLGVDMGQGYGIARPMPARRRAVVGPLVLARRRPAAPAHGDGRARGPRRLGARAAPRPASTSPPATTSASTAAP